MYIHGLNIIAIQYFYKLADTLFGQDNLSAFQKLMAIFPQDCREMFEDKNFIMGLRAQNFDLVIVDYWHFNPCSLLLPHNLSVPFIVQSSILIPPWAIGKIEWLNQYYIRLGLSH